MEVYVIIFATLLVGAAFLYFLHAIDDSDQVNLRCEKCGRTSIFAIPRGSGVPRKLKCDNCGATS